MNEVAATVFGHVAGQPVEIYTLANARGIEAQIMTFGASIVSLKTPDRRGCFKNIVLGFETFDPYLAGVPYYGAIVGRYANRIANAHFTLDGAVHSLAANDAPNSLHGGARGFDKRLWKLAGRPTSSALSLTYTSAAGEEGFPGQVVVHVTFGLMNDDCLSIAYEAMASEPTPLNLTNHAYFNLSGDPTESIIGHLLEIKADRYAPVNSNMIPTGALLPVASTPFDFLSPMVIGSRIDDGHAQLTMGRGYDHNWVLNNARAQSTPSLAAVLTEPRSGRVLEVHTAEPGLQFYSGNAMDGRPAGEGSVYGFRCGLCLETQHFPDSPNQPAFPDTILRPGKVFSSETLLQFRILEV